MSSRYKRVDPKRWSGVYAYTSSERRHEGKPDVCYVIAFKLDGKLKWETVGWKSEGTTPPMAAAVRADRMKQIRHGEEVKTSKEIQRERRARNRPLSEIAQAYFESKGTSLKGRSTDQNRWNKHLQALVGGLPAGDLSELDIARIKKTMQGRAPATVWNALELLRRIVNYGARQGRCPALKFRIEMPRKDNERTEYLSGEQFDRLMEVLANWRKQDVARMLRLAMATGMRRGEIFKLQTLDLDFRLGFITIRQPKGGKTVTIPVNAEARSILEEQLEWRSLHYPESSFVFPGRNGGQRTDTTATDRIKLAAGLPKEFRMFHGLRHHFGVMLANSGQFSRDEIQDLLTHKSPAMTARYAQFLPDTRKQASERAAELIFHRPSVALQEADDDQKVDA